MLLVPLAYRGTSVHSTTLFSLLFEAHVGSRGSPRLASLQGQDNKTTAQFRLWLRDETKGLTLDDAKKPMLSRIFLWYAGDFESRGGSPQYAARYAPPGAAKDALATMAPSYFAYDWNLNTQ